MVAGISPFHEPDLGALASRRRDAGAPRFMVPMRVRMHVAAPHEPERLLSPALSSIQNGGEGGQRPGEEALWVHGFTARNSSWETSHPGPHPTCLRRAFGRQIEWGEGVKFSASGVLCGTPVFHPADSSVSNRPSHVSVRVHSALGGLLQPVRTNWFEHFIVSSLRVRRSWGASSRNRIVSYPPLAKINSKPRFQNHHRWSTGVMQAPRRLKMTRRESSESSE